MNRRNFLKKLSNAVIMGGATVYMTGCKPSLSDFYSFDGSLLNGITWSNYQLSVNIGSEGTYDTQNVIYPAVIKDGSTYKMWYAGVAGGTQRIIYAESSNGVNWSNFQLSINIGAEGTYDTSHATTPTVIKDGSTYKMWYGGHDGTNERIIYAESSNGVNWSNFQLSINIGSEGTYDTMQAESPTVIKDNGTYKMWYGGSNRVIYAASTDGISWSNFQLVVNIGSEGTYDTTWAKHPTVIKDGATYKMWYAGHDGANERIIYAESSNGITWSNFQLSVNIGAEGIYDILGAAAPSVINVGGLGKMWYHGQDGSNWRIIYAESR